MARQTASLTLRNTLTKPQLGFLLAGLICGGFALGVAACRIWATEKGNPLSLTVELLSVSPTECIVRISLANRSRHSLAVDANKLPWNLGTGPMIVAVVEEDGFVRPALSREAVIADSPVPVAVKINARSALSKDVHLEQCFPTLMTVLQRNRAMLLWGYDPPTDGRLLPMPQAGRLKLALN